MKEQKTPNGVARGAFLLPNALTTGALMAGFFAIVSAINGQPVAACIAILIAGVLDGLDGRVARLTNTQSEFGVQYDSLSDMVSFGMAPAVLVYTWALSDLGEVDTMAANIGWLGAFFYCACAALRLARFNTQAGVADKAYFQGLASPAAAGTIVAAVWFSVSREIEPDTVAWIVLVLTILLGTLMFSRVRYFSFKAWPARDRVPIAWIFVLLVLLVLLAIDLPAVLLTIGLVYVFSGPVVTFRGRYRQRRRRRREGPDESQ
ncbi:CDP-diacylglycerol--serine O-phosphatidyltransferase [Wenzhouxiangella sp. AB-CW3]|uniref:CDP-diacylglycerol--serine O-phosphatidyltransferase n=1 Tax=Wenzhouxiangella sp. AB-CW3 TaxID=2771012 RepID=UPI00168AEC84|nr:CDP-diacylglycerol--serine O-phosphatidyltransferase [Wenzhouxiangella sp. AB-CW3]QOC23013.1 CDP-diacylglycerol--serine O-phosphatidyltransferase [Wenzhouxiangella sp. AB-CW3]